MWLIPQIVNAKPQHKTTSCQTDDGDDLTNAKRKKPCSGPHTLQDLEHPSSEVRPPDGQQPKGKYI
jgi:hypothetical protein